MPAPETQGKRARLAAETERIKAAYTRRQCGDLYSWFTPAHLFIMQDRERRVLNLLKSLELTRLEGQKILEVGCGTGYWLGEFIKWGARPENLTGIDLLSEKLVTPRSIQASKVGLVQANAAYLPFPSSYFDIFLQSMVFTSILDPAGKVVKVYNGRGDVENRSKEGKNTLRWDKTSCQRFEANQARLKMGVLAYNLLHMIRQFYVWGEEVRRSIDWLIKRLIKVGARVSYHARRCYVHVASAFPLADHYRAVLARGSSLGVLLGKNLLKKGVVCQKSGKKINFDENFCYHAFGRTICLQKEKLFRD